MKRETTRSREYQTTLTPVNLPPNRPGHPSSSQFTCNIVPPSPHHPKPTITFRADRDELDALAGDVVERLVDVGDLVEAHLPPVGLRKGLAGYDLEEEHELEAVAEVVLDVIYGGARLAQVAVAPGCECLELERDGG